MKMTTQDYLKKALLDTQERVRDFKNYSDQIKSDDLKHFFADYAESEGRHAQQLRSFLENLEQ